MADAGETLVRSSELAQALRERDEARAALAAERERCAKVEAELRAVLEKREDEWNDMHDALRRCAWEGLSSDGKLVPSQRLADRLSEARVLLRSIDGAPAPQAKRHPVVWIRPFPGHVAHAYEAPETTAMPGRLSMCGKWGRVTFSRPEDLTSEPRCAACKQAIESGAPAPEEGYKKRIVDRIEQYSPCSEAQEWLGDRTDIEQAWNECPSGRWLIWLLGELHVAGLIDRRTLVLAACAVARLALRYVPEGEHRPRVAIETTEAWCRGEATIEDVRRAAYAAAAYDAYADAAAAARAYAAHDAAAYAADAYAAAHAAAADAADAIRSVVPASVIERALEVEP